MAKKNWTVKNHKQEISRYKRRCVIATVMIFIISLVLIGRLIYLQVFENQVYSTLSQQNLLTINPIEPNRGLIYDRNGTLLAKNLPSFNLSVIPSNIKNFQATLTELRKIIPITSEELRFFQKHRYQYRPHQPIPLKVNLNEEQVANFYIDQYRFPGVLIESKLLRQYPYSDLLSHVVGYVGRINPDELKEIDKVNYSASDYIGKTGIEKQYENQLHGKVGYEEIETDASGRTIRVLHRIPPTPGKNIYLTIDSKLQQAAMDALGDETGTIIAVNPNNGEVLAMVSKPGFDPNLFVTGISQKDFQDLLNAPDRPLYNRDTRGLFSPASTIKPLYALGGLAQNVISPNFKIVDHGTFTLPNSSHIFHDWKKGGHGVVNVSTAITASCDTFFYTLATLAGIHRMDQTLKQFGYGQPTHIDLPRELSGLAPSPAWKKKVKGQAWFPGDTVNVGVGQGYILVTPLQLAQAAMIIANRGKLIPLHLLLKYKDGNGNINVPNFKPKQMIAVKDSKIWDIVIKAMQNVISSPRGTAYHFGKDAPYTAAGKTGTAQIFGKKGNVEEDQESDKVPKNLRNNHLFIGFAPIDHPQIVVAVVYEHAAGADGVARTVMDAFFQEHLELLPSSNKQAQDQVPPYLNKNSNAIN